MTDSSETIYGFRSDKSKANTYTADKIEDMEDSISSLQGVTGDTGWESITLENGTGNLYYREIGKIVYLHFISIDNIQSATQTQLATLPSGCYAPLTNTKFAIPSYSTLGEYLDVTIRENGKIYVQPTQGGTAPWRGEVCYVAAMEIEDQE